MNYFIYKMYYRHRVEYRIRNVDLDDNMIVLNDFNARGTVIINEQDILPFIETTLLHSLGNKNE